MSHQRIYRRPLKEGERVSVHMNLNNGLLVVESREGDDYGTVLQHRESPVIIADAEFRVQDGGLQTLRESERRQVCAYVLGRVVFEDPGPTGQAVRFNPFDRDRFHFRNGNESTVTRSPLARFWVEPDGPRMQSIVPESAGSFRWTQST